MQEEVDVGIYPSEHLAAEAHDLAARTLGAPKDDLNFDEEDYPCTDDLKKLPPAEFVVRMQRYAEMSAVRGSKCVVYAF